MTSGDEAQNNREAGHEANQPNAGNQKSTDGPSRQPSIEAKPTNKKKKGYFGKVGNWVTLLTLLFVAAYTIITFVQWRGNHIFNKKQLRIINAQLGEMRSSSNQTDQTIGILRDQVAALKKSAEGSEKAADATKRSVEIAEATQRAWIAPVKFEFAKPVDAEDPLRVRVFYQNIGREPAKAAKNWLDTSASHRFCHLLSSGASCPHGI
jgi:hypothetical protein